MIRYSKAAKTLGENLQSQELEDVLKAINPDTDLFKEIKQIIFAKKVIKEKHINDNKIKSIRSVR